MTDEASELPAGLDTLGVVRRFEPVLRFTAGELFFPMRVEEYLGRAALWAATGKSSELLIDHGRLDAGALVEAALTRPDAFLYLRYAPKALGRRELKAWRRRADRPKFTGVTR